VKSISTYLRTTRVGITAQNAFSPYTNLFRGLLFRNQQLQVGNGLIHSIRSAEETRHILQCYCSTICSTSSAPVALVLAYSHLVVTAKWRLSLLCLWKATNNLVHRSSNPTDLRSCCCISYAGRPGSRIVLRLAGHRATCKDIRFIQPSACDSVYSPAPPETYELSYAMFLDVRRRFCPPFDPSCVCAAIYAALHRFPRASPPRLPIPELSRPMYAIKSALQAMTP